MRYLIFLLFTVNSFAQVIPHKDFYISAAGSGSGVGTQADPLTAAQLVAGYATYFGTEYVPYDTKFWFRKGDIFDIEFLISKPCDVDAYGTGAKPIIRGSDDISTGWTHDGSNIYYRTVSTRPKAVFVGNTEQRMASTDWYRIVTKVSPTVFTSSGLEALNTIESLVGAIIIGKEAPFRPTYETTVSAYSSNQITIPNASWVNYYGMNTSILTPVAGDPFKLFNKKSFIDEVGEWTWDDAADRLYIKTAGGAPTNIRIATRDYGIQVSANVPDVSIQNLEFTEQYLEGIFSESNNDILITACTFHDIHLNGISVTGNSKNITVSYNELDSLNGNAIHVGGVQGGSITRNEITNIGIDTLVAPVYNYFRSIASGINIRWDSASNKFPQDLSVTYNNITNVGYSGINFCGRGHTIQNNIIDNYCLTWADGGGIYGIHRMFGKEAITDSVLIDKNIIMNGIGNLAGYNVAYDPFAEGIYIDNNSTLVTITNNVVYKITDYGILINFHVNNCTVIDNIVLASVNSGLTFRDYPGLDNGYAYGFKTVHANGTGHVSDGNISVARAVDPICMEAFSFANNTNYNPFTGGSVDNNHYVSPYSTAVARHNITLYGLAGWQTKISGEASSTALTNYLTFSTQPNANIEVMIEINDTETSENFNIPAGYTDVYGNAPSNPYTILPYSALIYLKETEAP